MRFDFMICDLDGTLLDTAASITTCLNRQLERFQLPLTTVEETKARLGNGSRALVEETLAASGAASWSKAEKTQFLHDYDADYLAHPIAETTPYSGIASLLDEARQAGMDVAVFSNKPDAIVQRVIHHFFGDLKARGQREDTPKKPNPEGLWALMAEAGVDPKRVLYVGDTEVDAQTGENAGVTTWLVTYGFRTPKALEAVPAERKCASVSAWQKALRQTFDE